MSIGVFFFGLWDIIAQFLKSQSILGFVLMFGGFTNIIEITEFNSLLQEAQVRGDSAEKSGSLGDRRWCREVRERGVNMDKWKIIGIDKTKDKEAIKNAYRSKLVYVNPEDDGSRNV